MKKKTPTPIVINANTMIVIIRGNFDFFSCLAKGLGAILGSLDPKDGRLGVPMLGRFVVLVLF